MDIWLHNKYPVIVSVLIFFLTSCLISNKRTTVLIRILTQLVNDVKSTGHKVTHPEQFPVPGQSRAGPDGFQNTDKQISLWWEWSHQLGVTYNTIWTQLMPLLTTLLPKIQDFYSAVNSWNYTVLFPYSQWYVVAQSSNALQFAVWSCVLRCARILWLSVPVPDSSWL